MNQAQSDPVIDEIRDVRRRISARVNHDPGQLVAYYRRLQEKQRDCLLDVAKSNERDDEPAA